MESRTHSEMAFLPRGETEPPTMDGRGDGAPAGAGSTASSSSSSSSSVRSRSARLRELARKGGRGGRRCCRCSAACVVLTAKVVPWWTLANFLVAVSSIAAVVTGFVGILNTIEDELEEDVRSIYIVTVITDALAALLGLTHTFALVFLISNIVFSPSLQAVCCPCRGKWAYRLRHFVAGRLGTTVAMVMMYVGVVSALLVTAATLVLVSLTASLWVACSEAADSLGAVPIGFVANSETVEDLEKLCDHFDTIKNHSLAAVVGAFVLTLASVHMLLAAQAGRGQAKRLHHLERQRKEFEAREAGALVKVKSVRDKPSEPERPAVREV